MKSLKIKNSLFLKLLLLLVVIILSQQACVYDLEEDTSSVLLIENLKSEDDILAALSPLYRKFEDIVSLPYMYQICGYGSDDITTWWAGNKAPLRVFDQFDYGEGGNSGLDWLERPWNDYWKIIYYANTLIDGLKNSSAPQESIAIADAEAKFLRALCYLNLVKGWGNMPLVYDGVKVTGDETRATVLENYQKIEEDLKIAELGLPQPSEVKYIGRASSAAAKAVLADLYLNWAGWPVKDESKYLLAANKAKEVVDMNYFELLPINKLWLLESSNSLESIFAIQWSKAENILSSWPNSTSFHESRGWSDMYPERQFFYDFPGGPRKDVTFNVEIPQRKVVEGVIEVKDPATIPWENSQRNHPMYGKFTLSEDLTLGNVPYSVRATELYRYAEILLIYAEASARANGGNATGNALEAFNQVRRRAAGLPYNQANADVDLILVTADEIVEEKGWELAGEGKRWCDLVRMEKVAEVTARRDPTEEVALAKQSSAITWHQYIAPIPTNTISTSKLIQNPEGFKVD